MPLPLQRSRLSRGRSARARGPADLNFFPIYGQSLSVGQTPTLLSSAPSALHKMFNTGVRVEYTATPTARPTSLVALREQADAAEPWNLLLNETPCSGAARMIQQLVADEDGGTHRMLMSAPGYGAVRVDQLTAGTTPFARMVTQCEDGNGLAGGQGWSFATQAVGWIQGESDYINGTTQAGYKTNLQALIGYLNSYLRGGRQEFTPQFLVLQIASHLYNGTTTPTMALAQAQACAALPTVAAVVAAMYQFDYQSPTGTGDWHLTTESSLWAGAYLGLGYKRRVVDGDTTWTGLQIASATKNGNAINLTFAGRVGALAIDTTWVTEIDDYGFQVVDGDGDPVTISSVTTNGTTLTLNCANSSGASVRYAWDGTSVNGREAGARGNLRDSQGDSITFEIAEGDVRPMHNWLQIAEVAAT